MKELLLTLSLERMDELTAFVDDTLCQHGCPTTLRMQAEILVEELYTAALYGRSEGPIKMSCIVKEDPVEVVLRLRSRSGPVTPELGDVHRLCREFPICFGGDNGVFTIGFPEN